MQRVHQIGPSLACLSLSRWAGCEHELRNGLSTELVFRLLYVGCVMMLDKGGQIVQQTGRTLFGRFYRDNPEMAAVLQIHTTGRQLEMKRGCIPASRN